MEQRDHRVAQPELHACVRRGISLYPPTALDPCEPDGPERGDQRSLSGTDVFVEDLGGVHLHGERRELEHLAEQLADQVPRRRNRCHHDTDHNSDLQSQLDLPAMDDYTAVSYTHL